MKTLIPLGAALLVLLGDTFTASANHRRQLDDLAFSVLATSRDIRWAVRDEFTQSGDLRYLCRESDDVFATARNLQDAIFRGRTLPVICRNIDNVRMELCEFEERLHRCDFARHTSHRVRHGHNGYSFVAGSQHGDYGHVAEMQSRIDELKQTLDAMHAIADGQSVVIPQLPVIVDPPLPTVPSHPGPQLPHLNAPLTSRPHHRHDDARTQVVRRPSPTFNIGGLRVTLGD